jgi:hypothetical protein
VDDAAGMTPIVRRLLSLANADGGFGAHAGLASSTEPTALAALALADETDPAAGEALERARAWLVGTQTPDGGWPSAPGLVEPTWATPLAVLALARDPGRRDRAVAGARWTLAQEGRRLPRARGFADWLLGRETPVEYDDTLTGWAWRPETFSWIEPTAYAVLALDAVADALPADDVRRRVDVARRMIADRACPAGGWNYGNGRVLGEDLWPYPDTTALALLALRGGPERASVAAGLAALERMLDPTASGLATALGVLALAAWGHEVDAHRIRLRERFLRTGLRGETRALAYAAAALNPGARPFGALRHA